MPEPSIGVGRSHERRTRPAERTMTMVSAATDGLAPPRRILAAIAIGMGIAMAVLDAAVVNVALPSISAAMHGRAAASVWVVNSYQLAIVATLLPLAAAGGRFGFKRIYVAGLVLFGVGSAACAASPSLGMLIGSRALQGLGAGAIMSANGALIRFTYPKAMIGWGVGVNSLVVSVSAAAGPSLAALILAVSDWRWLFLVNLPIGALNLAVASRSLPGDGIEERTTDWTSCALTIIAFASVFGSVGLATQAGTRRLAAACGVAGALSGLVLVRRETTSERPVVPFDLLRGRTFGSAFLASTTAFAAYMTAFVALPFLLGARGDGPARVGLLITPWPMALGVAAAIAGRLSDRLRPSLLSTVGMAMFASGLISVATMPSASSDLGIAWRLSLCGSGFGFFQAPNSRVLLSGAPRSRAGAAGGAMAMARMIGMTAGAALAAPFLKAPTLIAWTFWSAAGLALVAGGLCLARDTSGTTPR